MRKLEKIGCLIVLFFVLGVSCIYHVNAQKYHMTYLYGTGDYLSMIGETKGILNEVSPSYFDIDETGNLKLNTIDQNLVRQVHQQGMKVVPFFSNHWNREIGRKALANREKMVSDIVNAINQYDLDGVNIDLENLNENDREAYVLLAKSFREKLPSEKSVVVSVAANPYHYQSGWHASYDYEKLSQYADYLMIMAYDEHYEGGEAGPVASIHFVKKSIEYALQRVDKSKIVLGLPLYGRFWAVNRSYGGEAISIAKANELSKKYLSDVSYDATSESLKITLVIQESDIKPKVNGKTLSAGQYVIWCENNESLRRKLDLVNEYQIKGTGTWRLGLEEKSMWDVFQEVFQEEKYLYDDVLVTHWASNAIRMMKEKGFMIGRTKEFFAGEEGLTRAEMATLIARILELNGKEDIKKENPLEDIKGHWAERSISNIYHLGIVNGYEDGLFRPDRKITRGEIAKMVSKMITSESFQRIYDKEYIEVGNTLYMDLNGTEWFYPYIIFLSQKNLLHGYADGTFRAFQNVSRAETAQLIYNIISF